MAELALITGASSGIGAAFARRLARDGHDLILVGRRRERLDRLAEELAVAAEVRVHDLAVPAEVAALETRIREAEGLSVLVNNAGFGGYGKFAEVEPDQLEDQIRVQSIVVARLTRAALPAMIAQGRGTVINVSSRLAFSATLAGPRLPDRAVYAATKSFINVLTRILATELAGTGVRVQALCPGLVRTEFHSRMGLDPTRFPPELVMSPEDLVEASLRGLALGEVVCIPGLGDPALLAAVEAAERELFERSNTGTAALRYRVRPNG
jgi:short-subunit dehydrogenase